MSPRKFPNGDDNSQYYIGYREGVYQHRKDIMKTLRKVFELPCPNCGASWKKDAPFCTCSVESIIEKMGQELRMLHEENSNLCTLLDETKEDLEFWKPNTKYGKESK